MLQGGVTSYNITPQKDRFLTFKVIDFANVSENHTLKMPVNPSSKMLQHDIRTTLTQTEGGAWIDDFGMGVPILQLQGNTGWRARFGTYNGALVDGFQSFYHFYIDIIKHFFDARAISKNPNAVELLAIDDVERITYRMMPTQNFSDTRSTSAPLLYPYSVTFIVLWSSNSSQALKPITDTIFISNPSDRAIQVKTLTKTIQSKASIIHKPPTRTYTVQSGDTLSAIAQLYYGNGSLYRIIAKANHIANPDLIYPGQVLIIPYQ